MTFNGCDSLWNQNVEPSRVYYHTEFETNWSRDSEHKPTLRSYFWKSEIDQVRLHCLSGSVNQVSIVSQQPSRSIENFAV